MVRPFGFLFFLLQRGQFIPVVDELDFRPLATDDILDQTARALVEEPDLGEPRHIVGDPASRMLPPDVREHRGPQSQRRPEACPSAG